MGRNRSALVALLLTSTFAIAPALAQQPAPAPAPAPPAPENPVELARQGNEAFKAGNYELAASTLERAHQLDPTNRDTLFALAQAERLSNQCGKAVPHYKALLDLATDVETGTLVERNLSLCPTGAPIETAPLAPAPPPAPPPPVVIEKPHGTTNAWLLGGGGLALGAGVALFLGARADHEDALSARSFADHDRIETRADRMQIGAIVSLAVGVGLTTYAVYRIKFRGQERATEVAVMPSTSGGMVTLSGGW